jgi:hypothetical protein
VLLTLLVVPSQMAGENGAIFGTAVNGTIGGTPLTGAEIVLRVSQDGAFVPVTETTTDGEGRFAFKDLPVERGLIYLAGVNRGGVHYPGPRVRLEPARPEARVKLIAYDATESPSPLVCRRHDIAVQPQEGFVEITESLSIENPSLTAFVGQPGGDVPSVTLRLSLPEGFDKVTFDKEFHGRSFHIAGGKLTTALPWPPGSRDLQFVYRLPAEHSRCLVTRVLDLPTDHVQIRVLGKDGGPVTCNLPKSTAKEGETSFANRGDVLLAGHKIELQLGAVPLRFEVYGRWIAVAVLAVLVLGSALTVWRKRALPVGRNERQRGRHRPARVAAGV